MQAIQLTFFSSQRRYIGCYKHSMVTPSCGVYGARELTVVDMQALARAFTNSSMCALLHLLILSIAHTFVVTLRMRVQAVAAQR